MKEQQFDKHFNLKTYKPENLSDHTYEKKQRLKGSLLRSGKLNTNGTEENEGKILKGIDRLIHLN